jgi:ribonucleoside-diphosphate reductase alpha subunit
MQVVKRSGTRESVRFEKITARIARLCYRLDKSIDPAFIAQKVCAGVFDGVTTSALDELAAETSYFRSSIHPDYGTLAARLVISDLHKRTKKVFSDVMDSLYSYVEPTTNLKAPLVSKEVWEFINANKNSLNEAVLHDRDFTYDYFGAKTLMRGYLLKLEGKIVERPNVMLLRVACGIHCGDLTSVLETYNLLSLKWFTHATPTCFNSGTPRPQLASCFLQATEDSIEGIYRTLTDSALISKHAGGIGLSVTNVRGAGSYIRGTNGTSNGLVPMLRVFNASSRWIDQGGKRAGSISIYLEPWHSEIFEFISLRDNKGADELRARDLFLALWCNDEFMRRIEADQDWSLMCPNMCPGLVDAYGKDFDDLYRKYEKEGKAKKVVKARDLWTHILKQCIQTGTPYLMFKDACNAKSNHNHLGTIRGSNLCTEILEYSTPEEPAVCNLASISLPACVHEGKFDFDRLAHIVRVITKNLNRVIDRTMYPVPGAKLSNTKHRPIGIGTQGQSDVAFMLKLAYTDAEFIALNKDIYETIYYAALDASCTLAEKDGPHPSYPGSSVSKGFLQFDLWNKTPSTRWDWPSLRARIAKFGVRNSLLVAPMPTASTSQILGNYESFEIPTSNFYSRRTLAGEFAVINRHLLRDLIELGLWGPTLRDQLIADKGSVQKLDIPDRLKEIYKTTWEVKLKDQMDRMLDRAPFIDQAQSFNVHVADCTIEKLTSIAFYSWKRASKNGWYYCRSTSASDAKEVTVARRTTEPSAATAIVPHVETKQSSWNSKRGDGSAAVEPPKTETKTSTAQPQATELPLKRSSSWNGDGGITSAAADLSSPRDNKPVASAASMDLMAMFFEGTIGSSVKEEESKTATLTAPAPETCPATKMPAPEDEESPCMSCSS